MCKVLGASAYSENKTTHNSKSECSHYKILLVEIQVKNNVLQEQSSHVYHISKYPI